jgi:maleylpyruvate isomerase
VSSAGTANAAGAADAAGTADTAGQGRPSRWVDGCVAAQKSLDVTVAHLDETDVRGPSRLAGWSVGHVLTHLARNADSVVWRLEGAARGEVRDQYPGGLEQRRSEIDAGAGRPAAELVDDVRRSSAAVEEAMRTLPDTAWEALSRSSRGREETSREVVLSRWREVVVHHGDLGITAVSLPADLVDEWLPRELPRLAARTDPVALLWWIVGRGEPPALDAW